jgi:hypothetical protein
MNKVQRSRRRNIIGFSSEVHMASHDDKEDDAQAVEEEADILQEAAHDDDDDNNDSTAPGYANTTSEADESSMMQSQFSSFLSGSPFSQQIEKLGSELDVLVRHVMRYTEGLSEGGTFTTVSDGPEAETFSMLNFAFEDWDL